MNKYDEALYVQCKLVYESLGWDDNSLQHYLGGEIYDRPLFESDAVLMHAPRDSYAPLYTTDYLLGKLPSNLDIDGKIFHLTIRCINLAYNVCYSYTGYGTDESKYIFLNDTPLKALLQLATWLKIEGKIQ